MKIGPYCRARRGENLRIASLVVLLSACTDATHRTRALDSLGAALETEVSPEFDVQAYPTVFDDSVGTIQLACGAVRCLAAYDRDFGAGVEHALMTRLDPVTGASDLPRLRLGVGEHVVSVHARGDEFLVITEQASGQDVAVRFRRVRGSDAAILADDPTQRLPSGVPVKVAASETTWMLAYDGPSAGETVTYVYDADFELVGGPTTLPDFYPSLSQIIVGEGDYLLSSYGKAVRISESTGEAVDATPIDWGKYSSINAEGVYQDGVYLYAWGGQTIESARINATTMALFNPPDDFNQVPEFQSVYTNAGNTTPVSSAISSMDVLVGRPMAHWRSGNYVYGLALDAATGYRPTGEVGAPRALLFYNGNYDLYPVGLNTVALAENAYVVLAPPVSVGEYPDFEDTFRPLNATTYPATAPEVASNGTGFLSVWMQSRPEDTDWAVLASHLDPDTGAYLDDPPLLLGVGSYPRVASNGTDYLVQWDTGSKSERRMVYANGTLGDVISSDFRGGGKLVWNGSRFLYTRGRAYARFEPGGTAVGAETEVGNDAGFTGSTAIEIAAAVDTTPEAALRTALLVGEEGANIQGNRLRVQSGNIVSPYTTIFTDHERPIVASNGTEALVIAHEKNGTLWSGVLVNISSGETIEATRRELFDVDYRTSVAAALYDGSAFLVQLMRTEENTYPVTNQVYRFDSSLAPIGAEFPEPGTDVTFIGDAASGNPWSVNNEGRVALVSRVADVDRLGYAVKARFLDFSGMGFQVPSSVPTTSAPPISGTGVPNASATPSAAISGGSDHEVDASTPASTSSAGTSSELGIDSAAPSTTVAPGASAASSSEPGDGGEVPGNDDASTTHSGRSDAGPASAHADASRSDAGAAVGSSTEGCSCRVGSSSNAPPPGWLLALGAIVWWRRRGVDGVRASVAALLVASGCATDKQDSSCEGSEGCACYGNGTCVSGLACYSNFCVLTGDAALVIDASVSGLGDAHSDALPASSAMSGTSNAVPDANSPSGGSSSSPTEMPATSAPLGSNTDVPGVDAGQIPTAPTLSTMRPDGGEPMPMATAFGSATSSPTTPMPSVSSSVEPPVLDAAVCEQKLTTPPPVSPSDVEYNYFGSALSLSGDTLAIGSGDDELGNSVGAVYIYVRGAESWEFQTKLLPQLDDGTYVTTQNAQFGTTLSLDGDSLAVGSPAADPLGSFSGAVYTYVRSGTTWQPQGRVIAQLPGGALDGMGGDGFGSGVSLSGDTLAIGAIDKETTDLNDGAIYIYVRESDVWNPQAKLLPRLPNGDPDLDSGEHFGAPLSLDGDTLAVGTADADSDAAIVTGAVYIYSRSAEMWLLDTRVLAQLPDGSPDAEQWDEFGSAVSLSGDTLAVGARVESEQGDRAGAAYVYVRDGQDFVPEAKLFAQNASGTLDAAAGANFGWAVSLVNDSLFIGATGYDTRGSDLGMAYQYERQNNVWYPAGKIVAQTADGSADAIPGDHFGWSVSASGKQVAIAAPEADPGGASAGAVYLYSF